MISPSIPRETRRAERGTCRGSCRAENGMGDAEPDSAVSTLADEAEGERPSPGTSSTAHLCVFYNGVDKIPMEPRSMCEEFPPEI